MPRRRAKPDRPVLVLHAASDHGFVRGVLVPALEPAGDRRRRVDARDVATLATGELERALRDTGVTITVITPAFLTGPWSRLADLLASEHAIESDHDVIPLVLDDCELPLHIQAKVRLDFRARADWDRETRRLCDQLARPVPVVEPVPCPYPGMRPFVEADAAYFHGRDAEIDAMLALIDAGERELYVIGPSGSGKSSLVSAGVLPRLARRDGAGELVVHRLRPGGAPVERLAEWFGAAPEPAAIAAAAAAWSASRPGARLVVFIDQLEELFTQAPPESHPRFAAAVAALRGEPRCLIVLALRADFFAELLESKLWLDGARRHIDLGPLRGPALRAAIELPARALEVYLEPGLIERLLADAAGEPGVLPLLQETLVQLWGPRRRRRLLTLAAYEALGEHGRSGLAVAISSRADRCLRELGDADAAIARRILLRLVSFGEGRPDTRRRQPRAALAAGEPGPAFDGVLRRLVAARLLAMDGGGRPDDDHVDLCHDVLITAWPPFTEWVRTRRGDELRRRQFQASADEWVARGRGAGGLLDDGELAAVRTWRATDAARELGESPEVSALIAASQRARDAARRRRRRWIAGGFAGVIAFAAVTATLALIARREARIAGTERVRAERETARAETETARAVRALGEQYRELGRRAVFDRQLAPAIPYLIAARERGIDDRGLRLLFKLATASSVVASLRHAGPVTSASFSADGARIATASRDRTARLWHAATGAPASPPLAHDRPVTSAALRADAARLVTVCDDATAWIWDVTATPPSRIALRHAGRINSAVVSADGELVVTASDDDTVRLWRSATGAPAGVLRHDSDVVGAELSRDGTRVATTVRRGGMAGIWDAATGTLIAPFMRDLFADAAAGAVAHAELVLSAGFSRDGARAVTTSTDGTALVWDAVTGKVVAGPWQHGEARVEDAAFSPDATRVATASTDGKVRIWDVARGRTLATLDHPGAVLSVAYSHDGARLLSQGTDKIVRVWDAAQATLLAALELEAGALEAGFDRDAGRLVTASADGVARVGALRPAAPRVLGRATRMYDAVYSPDGARVAYADDAGRVWIWSAAGSVDVPRRWRSAAHRLAFDRDGRRLAVIAMDHTVVIWDPDATGPRAPAREPGVASVDLPGQLSESASFSPDGRRYATAAGARSARIWDAASGRPVTPELVHADAVMMVRFSPDGLRVATASRDGTARLWDAGSGAALGPPLDHGDAEWVTSATFSPDGGYLATVATDNVVRLWRAGSQRLHRALAGHAGWVIAAMFSRDGSRLLTHSRDHSARIWDVATGQLTVPPLEHAGPVDGASLSADGAFVATASVRLVQLWDAATGRPLGPPLVHPETTRNVRFSPDGNSLITIARDAIRLWDIAPDTRSLADWRALAGNGSFPQLDDALRRLSAPSRPR